MEKNNHYFIRIISNYKIIFAVYIIVAAISAYGKYIRGTQAYNNYLIFKYVYQHTVEQKNLFLHYPELYSDCNHYGIFFSIIIAPFFYMPDWMGMILWNIMNVVVFLFAIYKLPFSDKKRSFFAWLCLQEYITAAVSFQFNVALTGLLILSAVYIYESKEMKSALAVLIGTFVKIYGIVGLSSFFFIKNKRRFFISFIIIGIVFLLLPMLISGTQFGVQSYLDWYHSLLEKNDSNQILGNRQDFSLMGVVRRILGRADISNLIFIIPGLFVFALPYIRINQYKNLAFRLMILSSSLLFLVLFSSGSESPTYIIAVAGVMIWFLMQKKKSKLDIGILIFVMIFTCFAFSDLFPKFIKENIFVKYSTKAIPCIIVWFRVIYDLLTKDFDKDFQL